MSDVDDKVSDHKIVVRCGCFVRVIQYRTIKFITTILIFTLLVDMLYSLKLFISAVQVRSHLGYFINMISSGDGDVLPSLQAIPVLSFVLMNVVMAFTLYAAFDQIERSNLNRFMFYTALISFIFLIFIFTIIISVISYAYSKHQRLHDGIVTAMNSYSANIKYKSQMDQLQIEFQCCGSKKYDEWYNITWFDPSLEQEGGGSKADGNTPFSCCSIKSLYPCIHHNIEVTGKAYLYTPEFNLSISTRGCYEILRERKQEVGWIIVCNLLIFLLFESFTTILFRLIQTAHFQKSRFFGHKLSYSVWIFGCYTGTIKEDSLKQDLPAYDEDKMM